MRIKELVIEGFKSYPVRTVISGWDPSFNAITGLNGSGKSNILDAIAFVLGITNMSVMRAQNQQDLIYKRGQAGVTKASVTIVFDNSDVSKSPPTYENSKEITVTRQVALPNVSKYLLNGRKADMNSIQNLFQAVQLNINNPNFVIMQGRITKVLNMRPQEILGMVEEAAGTRMFEDRKLKAKRTMAKKEKRVIEITSLIDEDITPKLEKLRKEKQSFIQFQKGEDEFHAKGKKLHALEWTILQKRIQTKGKDVEGRRTTLQEITNASDEAKGRISDAEGQIKDLEKRKDKELQKGGKLSKLQAELDAIGLELAKSEEQVAIQKKTAQEDEAAMADNQSNIRDLEESLAAKKQEVEELKISYKAMKDQHDQNEEKLTSDESLLQSLLTGLTAKGGNTSGGGYMGQIAQAQTRITHAQTEEDQFRNTLAMKQKELAELQNKWKAEERAAGDSKRLVESLKTELAKIEQRLEKCGWDSEQETKFFEDSKALRAQVKLFTDQRDRVRSGLNSLDFNYDAPSSFDRRTVRGTLGGLVSLDKEHYDKAAALEAAAAGKLYQVIIDDEHVGKTLLTPGTCRLSRRVTFIPLNKVDAKTSRDKETLVANVTGGKGHLALSLVGYPRELYNAMAYAFGNVFICDDAASAKAATFSNARVRSVTLQGDVYEPSGTLSGGAPTKGSGVLIKVQEVLQAEAKLADAIDKLDAVEKNAQKMQQQRNDWTNLSRQVDMKKHELQLLEKQVEGSSAAHLEAERKALHEAVEQLKVSIVTAQEKKKEAEQDVNKLTKDMAEFKDNKDGKIDELRASITNQKKKNQKNSVSLKPLQKGLQTATLVLEQMEADIQSAKDNAETLIASMAKRNLKKVQDEKAKLDGAQNDAQARLDKEKETVCKYDNELTVLRNRIKLENSAEAERAADVIRIEEEIKNLDRECKTAIQHVAGMEETYDWIERDHRTFGQPGEYDFTGLDLDTLRADIVKLETTLKALKKKVNTKAAHMITDVEKREESLQQHLKTVMDDKKKIEDTIAEIDNYKREALDKTWTKVSKDFGDIFAELLPGNFAQLQPPEGQDMMDGLEVKVQLGTVWKQSLTELSGGQRSLIALSLIMALLQFKPAPMYILDEIDAALDLSHTQHIGHLFRTRFKGSQFIVVSLKEGLFTNANVLFKARFRDGTSIVERTATRSSSNR